MNATIWLSDRINVDWMPFVEFVQQMANRIAQGHARYGRPHKNKRYYTRQGLERGAYRRTGNREHLLNLANYAWLETQAPENKNFHWDSTVDSVTREKMPKPRSKP